VSTIVIGAAVSFACVFFCRRYMPAPKYEKIKLFRFLIYLVYLVGQVYKAGISCIGIVFRGAQVKVVEVRTPLKNRFLRTILANSITLVPGSVTLDLKGDKLTVLWLNKKDANLDGIEDVGDAVKGKLERMLDKTH